MSPPLSWLPAQEGGIPFRPCRFNRVSTPGHPCLASSARSALTRVTILSRSAAASRANCKPYRLRVRVCINCISRGSSTAASMVLRSVSRTIQASSSVLGMIRALPNPHRSPDVPPSWSTRPFLLLEAGAGRLPGPGPALAPDRNPAVPLGAAAEDWQIPGLLLAPAGAGGRVGGGAVHRRVNPRALWKQRGAVPKLAMIGVHFLGCCGRWAGRPSPCPLLWHGASARSLEGCRPT